ncbi:hypothetical protein NIE88_17285 [Sporolactobacillus shoreicorticis]|uniref:Uncharacterized protein n=1 Tax=Sporolactobacillus shoreicorticis TaxID=1923877 RepID=A0ABW5S1N5_9BACL|nr:hypothetical protein [Sporolactobacillus shoreicorticis]MCO7127513.1 hypothetical protein [Sporolactobacillus shoreicorticis]
MRRSLRKQGDKRINVHHFSWVEYIGLLVVLVGLAALPAIMYGANLAKDSGPYLFWYSYTGLSLPVFSVYLLLIRDTAPLIGRCEGSAKPRKKWRTVIFLFM